jgi:hypothetical protein
VELDGRRSPMFVPAKQFPNLGTLAMIFLPIKHLHAPSFAKVKRTVKRLSITKIID